MQNQPLLNSLEKSFTPEHLEAVWSQAWIEAEIGKPKAFKKGSSEFTMLLPPPNVTGTLHMGHAFNHTVMDILARYHRMQGERTQWIPGTDHAGIATQIVVERQLEAKGLGRQELGRKNFVSKIWEWKNTSGGIITEQMRRLGASVDWSQEYFTMDETFSRTVTETFVRLYEQGLIYRGKRLVNWDPSLKTAVSDLEVESLEEEGFMWFIRYDLADGSDQSLIIATTRPETLLGDAALMVHPNDARYAHLVGKRVALPLCNRTIAIIADDCVDMEFGTGVVKVTPAHDANDYAVGLRHQLETLCIFTLDAKINEQAPKAYQGLDRFEARKRIVSDLKNLGALVEIRAHRLMVPRCARTQQIIEPMLTDQWFMSMHGVAIDDPTGQSIAQKAISAVQSGEVQFVPSNWINTYNEWMGSIEDWCISRQLWWGHQIPAWYDARGNVYVARNEQDAQRLAGEGAQLRQDPDVLDTWYSSALAPFASMAPEHYENFCPTSTLVTGHDIIFFWVARMIMMTKHFTGKVPFKDVYIHGLVRDSNGRKMSKSEGNVIDPVDLIDGIGLPALLIKRTVGLRNPETALQVREDTMEEFPNGIPAYGADAVRMTFASLATQGRGINFSSKRCEGYRNFCNKIWNAARFVLMQCEGHNCSAEGLQSDAWSTTDRWMMSTLYHTCITVARQYQEYRLDNVITALYDVVWNEFCAWYLEIAKVQLQQGTPEQQRATRWILLQTFEALLRLLHPIMPFMTEELWQKMAPLAGQKNTSYLALAQYPQASMFRHDASAEQSMQELKGLITSIRALRVDTGITPSTRVPVVAKGTVQAVLKVSENENILKMMCHLSDVVVVQEPRQQSLLLVLGVGTKKEEEKIKLLKELDRAIQELHKAQNKLSNPNFCANAPQSVVQKEQMRVQQFEEMCAQARERLERL